MSEPSTSAGRSPSLPEPVTTEALSTWLGDWVARATGVPRGEVTRDRPLEEFGLSSRDTVGLAGELEEMLGVTLSVTLLWEHPTIASLARRLVEGEPEVPAEREADDARAVAAHDPGAEIAVVGVGTRLPGGVSTPDELWQLLVTGTDAVGPMPEGRWQAFTDDHATAALVGRTNQLGGFLDEVAEFDAEFFGISPREAASMDPQQRLVMEVTWEAMEHAGVSPESLRGSATGVFVGVSTHDYGLLTSSDLESAEAYTTTGSAGSIVANRLSYTFDLRGPSMALDAACSSSLVAVHQAIRSLRAGECDAALAGGVNLMLAPAVTVSFDQAGALSTDGRCKAFDAAADGISRGEGAGMVVLKRLADAQRDGDRVLAVLAGSAVNSDGRSNGLTAPNPAAQTDLLRAAYRDAGVRPSEVDYVEAHGTGTLLGDPIEARALGAVLGAGREVDAPLLLGSAKTNFGHLEAAAGIVALIKVVLAMGHDALPPSLHFRTPNPHIPFEAARLAVVTEPTAWPRRSGAATAGVSGFGFGGTNAHLVVREAPPVPAAAEPVPLAERVPAVGDPVGPVVLVVSGQTKERLRAAAADLAEWLTREGKSEPLPAVGRALARRSQGRHRAALVVRGHDDAVQGALAVAEGRPAPGVVVGAQDTGAGPVWVFSGYGSQWHGMARDLLAEEPAFAEAWRELEDLVVDESGFSLHELVHGDEPVRGVDTVQVVLYAVQVGLAAVLRSYGAEPTAVLGHSMGEVAAAVVSGGLSLEDGTRVICTRSRLLAELDSLGLGAMGLVGLSSAELAEQAHRWPDVSAAVHAAPQQTTVAGEREQVRELVAWAESLGRTARLLDVSGAGHTEAVDPVLGELTAELAGLDVAPARVPVFSSVTGDAGSAADEGWQHDVAYWTRGMRQPVLFAETVGEAVRAGHTTFLELSPHPVALPSVGATAAAEGVADPLLVPAQRRNADGSALVREALAQLWVHGHDVDVRALNGEGAPGELVEVPRTRWHRRHHWTTARPLSSAIPTVGVHVALPDGRHVWESTGTTDVAVPVHAAAAHVLGADAEVSTLVRHQPAPGAGVPVTTVLTPHPGGGSIQVHAHADEATWVLLAEAVVTGVALDRASGAVTVRPHVTSTGAPQPVPTTSEAAEPEADAEADVRERLRTIVAEVLGYAPNQLPDDVALVELGLDSMMAVRIKNRVEHELGTPPIVLEMLRGAGLADLQRHLVSLLAGDEVGAASAGEASGVPPRDAAERWVAAQWSAVVGSPVAGVTSPLPTLSEAKRVELAHALGGRWEGWVEPSALVAATTLSALADEVRPLMETSTGELVRVLQAPVVAPGERAAAPLFVVHPAGGSCSVYDPLIKLLPADQPVFGIERLEGPLAERVAAYLPLVVEHGGPGPFRLAGWSFGGALAYELGRQLTAAGHEVELVAMLDTVRPVEAIPDTPQETLARWKRFAAYVERTYGRAVPLPEAELLAADPDEQLRIILGLLQQAAGGIGTGISAGVLEHQRTSWVDNRALEQLQPLPYDGEVVLYRADGMHEGAVEIEPRYAEIAPDGGWSGVCPGLEVVHVGGDHLQVIDEPIISRVAADLRSRLARTREAVHLG
ncbi:polyketide synthase Pks13 [Rhodococcus aerolatus]